MVIQVCQVACKDGACEQVQHRRECHDTNFHCRSLTGLPADVVHELTHLLPAKVMEGI
jgi:hypothetical protein